MARPKVYKTEKKRKEALKKSQSKYYQKNRKNLLEKMKFRYLLKKGEK